MSQIFNIFPTTIYVGEVDNHNEYKTGFLKLYDKFDYEERMKYQVQLVKDK